MGAAVARLNSTKTLAGKEAVAGSANDRRRVPGDFPPNTFPSRLRRNVFWVCDAALQDPPHDLETSKPIYRLAKKRNERNIGNHPAEERASCHSSPLRIRATRGLRRAAMIRAIDPLIE